MLLFERFLQKKNILTRKKKTVKMSKNHILEMMDFTLFLN